MNTKETQMENFITIYGKEDCSKCKALIEKLKELNKPFAYNDDISTLRRIGSQTRIMSAPIINDNGKWYSYEKYLEILEK